MHRLRSGNWAAEIARASLARDGLGRRWAFSLETSAKREAQRRLSLLRRLIDLQEFDVITRLRRGDLSVSEFVTRLDNGATFASMRPIASHLTLQDVAQKLITSKSHRSLNTQRINQRIIDVLCDAFGKQKIASEIAAEDARRFLFSRDWSANTRRNARVIYRNAWKLSGLPDIWAEVQPGEATYDRGVVLSSDEIDALLRASADTRVGAVIALAFICGLRQGEITNLRPQDIDWKHMTLSIAERPNGWRPKTKRGIRTIVFGDLVLDLLAHHVEQYASKWWVFPSARDPGRPLSSSTLEAWLRPIFASAKIPFGRDQGVTLHTGRHTAISNALSRGIPVQVASTYFGDAPDTLYEFYAHLIQGDAKRVADAIDPGKLHPKLHAI